MKLPDELRHPSGGESIDRTAQEAVRLAHRALERFPELVRRHKFLAGGAAVSSALVALAGVAISRRMGNGESGDEAVERVTEQELAGLSKIVTIGGEVEVGTYLYSKGALNKLSPEQRNDRRRETIEAISEFGEKARKIVIKRRH